MRKLKLQVQMSVDGYIAGPKREMDWMVWNWDDALNRHVTELTENVDCILLGRVLAEGFIDYWAAKELNPDGEDIDGIRKMNETPKVVFTKTLDQSRWKNTKLATGDFVEEIRNLKNQKGKDMIVYGGGTFVSSLINAGLIDEYHLFVNPAALGSGMTIFKSLEEKQRLTLVNSKSFDCGIVVLFYRPRV